MESSCRWDYVPIRLHTVLGEEIEVLLPPVVGVSGNVAIPAVEGFARNLREVVPYRLSAAVDVERALNLETR